jgi:hypothetical protein
MAAGVRSEMTRKNCRLFSLLSLMTTTTTTTDHTGGVVKGGDNKKDMEKLAQTRLCPYTRTPKQRRSFVAVMILGMPTIDNDGEKGAHQPPHKTYNMQ